MMSPGPNNMMQQQQHHPMMSPGPNNMMMAPPAMNMSPQMAPQHAPQQMRQEPLAQPMHYEQPMAPQQPMYHQPAPAPAPQNVVYEQAPMPAQQVRFEPVSAQGQCAADRSPQQQPIVHAQAQLMQEVKIPEVITAPSAPPCELGGPSFKEYMVEEIRPVQQVMERGHY